MEDSDGFADDWGDEAVSSLKRAGLSQESLLEMYELLVRKQAMTLPAIARASNLSLIVTRSYLRILMEHEDIYGSVITEKDGTAVLHYCYAPQMLAQLCQRRKISLAQFLKLGYILDPFMERTEEYYVSRLQDERAGSVQISKLKRRFAKRVQPIVSPDTPLKDWKHPVSTHPAWRYLRTAQDLVLLKLDVARPFVDGLIPAEEVRRTRCACGRRFLSKDTANLARHLESHKGDGLDLAHVVVHCEDCGAARVVSTKDAFQVKRCVPCQVRYRQAHARVRRHPPPLKAASPSRRGSSRQEVRATATKAKKEKPAKPEWITIKCVDCGKERKIHPQDRFQVKRCAEDQKKHRLLRAKERRAARRKASGKPARKPAKATKKAPRKQAPKKTAPVPTPAEEAPAPMAEPT
jgi:ribosomal protein S27E